MISFLFWNLNKRPLQDRVVRLAREHEVDVLMLAECELTPPVVLEALSSWGGGVYCFPYSEAGKIHIYTRFPPTSLVSVFDDPARRLTVRHLILEERVDLLLAVVHFYSKRDWSESDQLLECGNLARDLAKCEERCQHQRTVLVGDLNMNPFEKGVVAAGGLHAVMTQDVAKKGARTVGANRYPFIYNPMWGHFGDRTSGPPGTHYFLGKQVTYFWNIYDQVLLRPDLMRSLQEVRILDSEGGTSLLTRQGRPDQSIGSDHLPVFFQLTLSGG
jgi:endonuclease/exonuclease/phosphatase family metal-dependent hydrolase